MKNKIQIRSRALIPNFRYIATPLALGIFLAHSATADIVTWNGTSNDNWSDIDNWDNGLPSATNDVVFADTDATGTAGPSGTVNNIVDATTTIKSLKYTNIQPGNHTTQIPTGVTLNVNGTASGNMIEVQSPIIAPATGQDYVVYATIHGDGTLAANNTAATLYVGQGSEATSATRMATLDLSGLETFSPTLGRITIGQQVTTKRVQGTLKLARNNTLKLSSTPGILVSENSSNAPGTSCILELGNNNTILTNAGITIGGRKATGTLRFNTSLPNTGAAAATFRNLTNDGPQAQWLIGDQSGQSATSTGTTGLVDFSTKGSVDALITNIILGRSTTSGSSTGLSLGTLTFDKGTIVTSSLTAGIQPIATSGAGRGIVNVNGTGTLQVNGNVTLGRDLSATQNADGLINIGGGAVTITGDVICGNGTGNKITLTTGSLTLGGKVGDDSVAGDAPLETLELGAVAPGSRLLKFDFGSSPNPAGSRVKTSTLNVPGSVNVSFTGSNSSLTPGTIELIKYTTFDQATQFANLTLVDKPIRVEATLVNNTANSSVDLNITSVSTTNKWMGNVDGNWDIDSTMNWKLAPSGTPSKYLEGEPVTFDDTATGTKTVNLTTALSPKSITVDTAATYTFNGAGKISGPATIIKSGSGSLVLANSGTNDFTGVVNIQAGEIQISSNDLLPVTTNATFSDVAGTALDLNNFNQTLSSLNGGGGTGGNVQLGTGTLTISGAGSYSGAIEGGGSLVKTAGGDQVFAGASTFSGGTTITGGRIIVANASGSGLGSGPVTVNAGASLSLGNGSTTGSITATTIANAGTVVINRSDDTTFDKTITGSGLLVKGGTGTLLFDSANTLAGPIRIDGGAIRVTHPNGLGSAASGTQIENTAARLELSGGISLAEPLTLDNKGSALGTAPGLVNVSGNNSLTGPITLNSGGSNWNIQSDAGKLTISGPLTNVISGATRFLRFYGAGDGEIQSVIPNNSGTGITAVVMGGAGTWTLSGTNTYTGATSVSSGTLSITGSLGASAVTVSGGTLGGSGTIGGTVTVAAAGSLAPGTSAGTLSIGGGLDISAPVDGGAGKLKFELGPIAASDKLAVTGTLTIGTDKLGFSDFIFDGITGLQNGTYKLITSGGISGTLDTVPANLTGLIEGGPASGTLQINGNDVELVVSGAVAGSAYDTWKSANAPTGNPDGDYDGDGVSNSVEFVLGGLATTNDLSKLPTLTTSGGNMLFSFKRAQSSIDPKTAVFIEVGTDLAIWNVPNSPYTVPDTAIAGPPVTVAKDIPTDFDTVTLSVPQAPDAKKFARLKVVITP